MASADGLATPAGSASPSLAGARLPIVGMTCAACATRVERALARVEGVERAAVNVALNRADVAFDPDRCTPNDLATAVRDAGYDVALPPVDLDVAGMTCASCVGRVEKALAAVPGVAHASVNLAAGRARVTLTDPGVTPEVLIHAVAAAGYDARVPAASGDGGEPTAATGPAAIERAHAIKVAVCGALVLPFLAQMIAMFAGAHWHLSPYVELALATPVQAWGASGFYRAAWRGVRARVGNMDLLVVLGTGAAYLYSVVNLWRLGAEAAGTLYFESASVVITMVLLGRLLEARAKRGTSDAIRALMTLRPAVAHVVRDGAVVDLPIDRVARDDIVAVLPGERVPVDGVILEGETEIDEAMITGESLPLSKGPGSAITAGTINGTGRFTARTLAAGDDTTLTRMIALIENVQAGKAPIQRLVDRVSGVFVPVIIVLAALTLIGWLATGQDFAPALSAAVAVLVIACPCALGLATPTAIVAGSGAAARAGILIKSVEALELAHRVRTVAFDKTGTLSEGHPGVARFVALAGDEEPILRQLAAVQAGSEHPIAKGLVTYAQARGLEVVPAGGVRSLPGSGVEGDVDGHRLLIGKPALLMERGIDIAAADAILAEFAAAGDTPVLAARDGVLVAAVAVRDPVRPQARAAIALLGNSGVRSLMLSGDAATVAERVAREVGIADYRGALDPAAKVAAIRDLQAAGHIVAMVGDGINDGPALAAADLSIAMGGGTGVAIAAADITLMRADPRLVAATLDISRRTWSKIWQNLFWAFVYNLVGVPFAALGLLSPVIAGSAMALSSVCVVGNSLLLRRWRPTH